MRTSVFIAALFTIAKAWNQPKCLSWMNGYVYLDSQDMESNEMSVMNQCLSRWIDKEDVVCIIRWTITQLQKRVK